MPPALWLRPPSRSSASRSCCTPRTPSRGSSSSSRRWWRASPGSFERSVARAEPLGVFADAAEAPLTLLEVADGLEQVLTREVGPEHGGEPQLRVRELPEQEVRRAHLAAGPDQQIGVG